VGPANADTAIRIVDPDGSDLPTGQAGELLVRGPNITSGYVGDPAATATAIRNGWLHTGDYCRVDAEGGGAARRPLIAAPVSLRGHPRARARAQGKVKPGARSSSGRSDGVTIR